MTFPISHCCSELGADGSSVIITDILRCVTSSVGVVCVCARVVVMSIVFPPVESNKMLYYDLQHTAGNS